MYLALELRYEVETALATISEDERMDLRVAVRLDEWQRDGGSSYPPGAVKAVLDALHRSHVAEAGEALPKGSTEELRRRIRDRVG